jgi:DMSO reductase anchor subunit
MKTNKTLYALLAFAPIIMVLVIFVLIGLMVAQLATDVASNIYYKNEFDLPFFVPIMVVAMLASALSLIGIIAFALHSQKSIHITPDKRTMWLLILIFTGTIGRIIYYFTWIAKEEALDAAKGSPFE